MQEKFRLPLRLAALTLAGTLAHGCAADDSSMTGGGGGKADDLERSCELKASKMADDDVDDLNDLLDIATTLDFPAMTIEKYQLSGCDAAGDSAEGRDQLAQLIADLSYERNAADFPEALVFSDLEVGGEDFADMVDEAVEVIEERIDDGLWEPSDDPIGEEIWNRVDEVTEAILEPIDDIGYAEQSVEFENAECSEDAVGLYSEYDEALILIHQLPRC